MDYAFAYRRYSLPFRAPVRTAYGVWSQREGLLVRLEREDGQTGFGECAPIPWFGTETADEAEAACAAFGARVSDAQIDAVPDKFGCVRFALETARGDACRAGEPHAQTARPEASPYLPIAALLPAGRAALEKAPAFADAGFMTFKWKVGALDAADELVLLDDVLAVLPAGARLRLDANGAWDRRVAERWLARCADCPVEFVEQPVAADVRGAQDLLLGLAGDWPTPLALDESLCGAGDVTRWLDAGWPGVFVLKPSLLGDARAALARLGGRSADVVFSSALETAVGARAALRLAFDFFADTGRPRALGFGVYPIFGDIGFDGPPAAPFVRSGDVEKINPRIVWSVLN